MTRTPFICPAQHSSHMWLMLCMATNPMHFSNTPAQTAKSHPLNTCTTIPLSHTHWHQMLIYYGTRVLMSMPLSI